VVAARSAAATTRTLNTRGVAELEKALVGRYALPTSRFNACV